MSDQFEQLIQQAQEMVAPTGADLGKYLQQIEGSMPQAQGVYAYWIAKQQAASVAPVPAGPAPVPQAALAPVAAAPVAQPPLQAPAPASPPPVMSAPPAPPVPGAQPGGQIGAHAMGMLQKISTTKQIPMETLIPAYWEQFPICQQNLGLVGDQLEEQVALFVQAKLVNDNSATVGTYDFTPLWVGQAYTRMLKQDVQKPGAPMGTTMEIEVPQQRCDAFGLITQYAQSGQLSGIGKVTGYEGPAAQVIEGLQAYTTYRGDFEGKKPKEGFFQLSLNEAIAVQPVGQSTWEALKQTTFNLIVQTGCVITPTQAQLVTSVPRKGKLIILEGRIGHTTTDSRGGRTTGSISMAEAGIMDENSKSAWIKLWDNVARLYDYAVGSKVYAITRMTTNKEYGNNMALIALVPILAFEGQAPQPEQQLASVGAPIGAAPSPLIAAANPGFAMPAAPAAPALAPPVAPPAMVPQAPAPPLAAAPPAPIPAVPPAPVAPNFGAPVVPRPPQQ